MNKKNKKKLYDILDIAWRVIGGVILVLFFYDLWRLGKDSVVNDTLNWTAIISLFLYVIISAIVFLPGILIKFFKKLKRV